jgi:hypothetical protein
MAGLSPVVRNRAIRRDGVFIDFFRNNEEHYFIVKMLTSHETLQTPPHELNVINAAAEKGYTDLYDYFDEHSHHGTHLCLVLRVDATGLLVRISDSDCLRPRSRSF